MKSGNATCPRGEPRSPGGGPCERSKVEFSRGARSVGTRAALAVEGGARRTGSSRCHRSGGWGGGDMVRSCRQVAACSACSLLPTALTGSRGCVGPAPPVVSSRGPGRSRAGPLMVRTLRRARRTTRRPAKGAFSGPRPTGRGGEKLTSPAVQSTRAAPVRWNWGDTEAARLRTICDDALPIGGRRRRCHHWFHYVRHPVGRAGPRLISLPCVSSHAPLRPPLPVSRSGRAFRRLFAPEGRWQVSRAARPG